MTKKIGWKKDQFSLLNHNHSHFSHCPKGFSVLPHLQDHENIHTDSRPYKCKYCDDCFHTIAAKSRHERGKHEGIKEIRKNKYVPKKNGPKKSGPKKIGPKKNEPKKNEPKMNKPKKKYPIKYKDHPCDRCGKIFR